MRCAFAAWWLIFVALIAGSAHAHAQERILAYHADIVIAADGSLDVNEHIRVQAEGDQIRHGIYRDFPTHYRDPQHHRVHIRFTMLDASLDGHTEDWHSEAHANGVRVYLGNKSTFVSPGEHRFVLHYQVNRELGFFADHDELYWNVNGTGWGFAIDNISASVRLPEAVGAAQLKAYGYTGMRGSREQALSTQVHDDGASFAATRPLAPHENLSIVLAFPKGIVTAPSRMQQLRWLLTDNRNLLYGLGGLLLLWLYYLLTWNRYGRDPAAGPLVAIYDPPDGDSAAALRYVRQMGYDTLCFTAGILGIAAKGGLKIHALSDEQWSAERLENGMTSALSADEKTLCDTLFAQSNKIIFKQSEHQRISAALLAHKATLAKRFKKTYFFTHSLRLLPGMLITVLALWLASRGGAEGTGFMLLWLSGWSVGVMFLLVMALRARRDGNAGTSMLWIITGVFSIGEIIGLVVLGHLAGFAIIPIFLALIATNVAFYAWMKAPTPLGAKLLDRINGFRWYLGVAEKQALDARYRPQSQPEKFATYLPYALALGVGNAWAERFADALTPAQMQQAQPSWYVSSDIGNFNSASFASFTSNLSSGLGSAIASSSVAPGSSSGSGGGSGGGGGGGGGGGW